jgi:hypothetical protein
MADLDRYDMFVPPSLYNYDHAQPFEQYTAQWRAFPERGGIIIALDANYGQMIGWVTRLGSGSGRSAGLELQSAQCPEGMKGQPPLKITAPDDAAAPSADGSGRSACKTLWAHFASFGKGWTVLATCPEGNAVCLRADIGKGILIATNLYDDAGFPSAEYLQRLWLAQWPRLTDHNLRVDLDRGPAGVGRKALRVKVGPPTTGTIVCEQRHGDGAWETQTLPMPADGQAVTVPVVTEGGRNDVRLEARAEGVKRWWTSWRETPPDVLARSASNQASLDRTAEALRQRPDRHPLRREAQGLQDRLTAVAAEARQLVQAEAGAETDQRWQGLDSQLATLEPKLQVLSGRAVMAARVLADRRDPSAKAGDRPFVVVRSEPLEKVFRDEPPAGPWQGAVQITAARGEGESAQVVIVPLRGDLANVRACLEPFRDSKGRVPDLDAGLHRVCYVHTAAPSGGAPAGRNWWPDPLLPADKPFAATHVCQPLWVDLWTPERFL